MTDEKIPKNPFDRTHKSSYYTFKSSYQKGKYTMIRAGVKDVKNNLSRLLTQVKAGDEILITERGKPIARIVKENNNEKSIRAALGPLIQKGLIALPSRRIQKNSLVPIETSGKPASEMVIEDRR